MSNKVIGEKRKFDIQQMCLLPCSTAEIPQFRLPYEVVQFEIGLMKDLGVKVWSIDTPVILTDFLSALSVHTAKCWNTYCNNCLVITSRVGCWTFWFPIILACTDNLLKCVVSTIFDRK